jgi:hypothetical protein
VSGIAFDLVAHNPQHTSQHTQRGTQYERFSARNVTAAVCASHRDPHSYHAPPNQPHPHDRSSCCAVVVVQESILATDARRSGCRRRRVAHTGARSRSTALRGGGLTIDAWPSAMATSAQGSVAMVRVEYALQGTALSIICPRDVPWITRPIRQLR